MDKLMKAVAVAVVAFFVVLGLTIGTRMNDNTIALLGGTTIGLLIAAPCAAIVTYLTLSGRMSDTRPDAYRVPQRGQAEPPVMTPHNHVTNNYVTINLPPDTPREMHHILIAQHLRVSPSAAKAMLASGAVKVQS